jgi:hypothetical protein
MKMSFRQALDAVRLWLGWGDLSAERASPPHGWLLPTPVLMQLQRANRGTARPDVLAKTPAVRG